MSVQEQQHFQDMVNGLHLEPGALTGFIGQPSCGRTSLLHQIAFELCRRGHRVLLVATEGVDPWRRALCHLAEVRPIVFDQLRQDGAWAAAQHEAFAALGGRMFLLEATLADEVERELVAARANPYAVMLVDNLNAIHFTSPSSNDTIQLRCNLLRGMAQQHGLASIFSLFLHRPSQFGPDGDFDQEGLLSNMGERDRGIVYRGIAAADDVWLVTRDETQTDMLDLSVHNQDRCFSIRIGLER